MLGFRIRSHWHALKGYQTWWWDEVLAAFGAESKHCPYSTVLQSRLRHGAVD